MYEDFNFLAHFIFIPNWNIGSLKILDFLIIIQPVTMMHQKG